MTRTLLVALALALCGSTPSGGWSPDTDDDAPAADPVDGPTGATSGPDLVGASPDAFAPPDPMSASAAPVEPPALPAPVVQPEGLYAVNEPWTGDQRIVVGDTTTYTSTAENRLTGTFARVADAVGTGQPSPFDGASFNDRMARSDGRPVAGTYYENYVPTADGFVLVSIVFFQDDSELALHPAPGLSAPAPAIVPVVDDARIPPLQSAPRPAVVPGVDDVRIPPLELIGDERAPITAPREGGDTAWDSGPASPAAPSRIQLLAPPAPDLRVGVDPTFGARLLDSLEVARGQRFALRVNAASEGRPVAIESWSLLSGSNDAANPSGWQSADTPLVGQWLRLAPPGRPWTLSLRVRARLADGRSVEGEGHIEIWVRAPAVVE